MKQYLLTSLSLVILTLVQVWQTWPGQTVKLIFCDVGQGDAILMIRGSEQVLIDGGRHQQAALACLTEQVPFWDRSLELVVATHADADHVGGLPAVLKHYAVKRFIVNSYDKDNQLFSDLKERLAEEVRTGMVLENPILGRQLVFPQEKSENNNNEGLIMSFFSQKLPKMTKKPPSMKFLILSPQETTQQRLVKKTEKGETLLSDVNSFFSEPLPIGKTHNDLSIVVFLKVGEATALLTGDIEEKGELSLLKWGLLSKTDILKVAHHGAKTSTSRSFIEVVQPEISVISVGANNSYGHPADRVLSLLQDYESQIVRTDREETIVYQLGENGQWFKDETRSVADFFWQLFRF